MSRLKRFIRPEQIRELVLLLLIVVVIIFFGTVISHYYTGRTFNRISTSVAIIAIVSVGQTLVILTRNIDLSVGSIVGFTAYFVGTQLAHNNDLAPIVVVLMAIGTGAFLGVINGLLVAYGKVPAIIVTLGTLAIYRTILVEYSGARTVLTSSLPMWIQDLPRDTLFSIGDADIRLMAVMALAVVVLFQLVLTYLPYGRRLYAIGSNPEAARIAGGRPGLALALATEPQVADFRRIWLGIPMRLGEHPGDAFRLADEVIDATDPLLAALKERQEEERADLGDAAPKALKDRQSRELKRATDALFVTGLEILASFYRDVAAAQYGAPVRNTDVPVAALSSVTPRRAVGAADRILVAVDALAANQRPKLALADLFCDLAGDA